jgi:mxaK protein
MKRRTLHATFAVAATVFAALAVHQALALQQARRVNAAIAAEQRAPGGTGLAQADATLPEARFARAQSLASARQYDESLKAYKALIQDGPASLRPASLYNLGNVHLREALKNGEQQAHRSMPLIELAKQSYRDLLSGDPQAWDARYNLERALWLAPEVDDSEKADDEPDMPKERSITTMHVRPTDLP